MDRPDYIPADYKRIKIVSSLSELFNAKFGGPDNVNCILFPRTLQGDFNALARQLAKCSSPVRALVTPPAEDDPLRAEKEFVRADILRIYNEMMIRGLPLALNLKIESSSAWERENLPCAFHSDSSEDAGFGRVLCSYTALVTEWLRNEDAIACEEKPGCYAKKEDARVYTFQPGDIWRQQTRSFGLPAFPETMERDAQLFIHRKPKTVQNWKEGDPPRVLLVTG
ncbi:MAG: hypothetical protein H6869_08850 [Rhodospirillales bacterium]|nr:hypothetical protein [Rhodospirillales bacterium]